MPALKFPDPSLATIAFAVLVAVPVVAELATLPAVDMVAKFASVMPAVPDKFAFVNPVIVLLAAAIVLLVKVSAPAKVATVPVVGKVTFVAPVDVSVMLFAPLVVKFPPSVIVFPVLSIPVPPFDPSTIPVI